jgi:cytochrome c peroxidase
MKYRLFISSVFFLLIGYYSNIFSTSKYESFLEEEEEVIEVPKGLPPIPWPEKNPYDKKKAELGRLLYFDKRLSSDGSISCGSCHAIQKAYTDNMPVSVGIKGQKGTRNSPTVINSAYLKTLFWDGRAKSLEEQCKGPIGNPKEMTLATDPHLAHMECEKRVKKIGGYCDLFKEIFGSGECTIDQISEAIATYERTVLSGNSPYDKYMAGDTNAMTKEQIRGLKVFQDSGCVNCHSGPNFSDGKFYNIGIGYPSDNPDLGRYLITKKDEDKGAFEVPILREVSKTFPYMHDGSLKTLEDVVQYYNRGGNKNENLNPLIYPLNLFDEDVQALVSFLKALDGDGWQHFTEPKSFPE